MAVLSPVLLLAATASFERLILMLRRPLSVRAGKSVRPCAPSGRRNHRRSVSTARRGCATNAVVHIAAFFVRLTPRLIDVAPRAERLRWQFRFIQPRRSVDVPNINDA